MAFKTANPDATRRHIRIIISQVAIRVKDGRPERRPSVLLAESVVFKLRFSCPIIHTTNQLCLDLSSASSTDQTAHAYLLVLRLLLLLYSYTFSLLRCRIPFHLLLSLLALSFRRQCRPLLSLPAANDPYNEEDEKDERDDGRCVDEEDEEVLESEGDADADLCEGVLHQESDV